MSTIGYGYGSEWHLLRYLGRHRNDLNSQILAKIGPGVIEWLDFPFDGSRRHRDGEWKGLDFLPDDCAAKKSWSEFWPQKGEAQNWDAVGQLRTEQGSDWVLVEAKAHSKETESATGASPNGGLGKIRNA